MSLIGLCGPMEQLSDSNFVLFPRLTYPLIIIIIIIIYLSGFSYQR